MEGICQKEIERRVLGKRLVVHTHPDYEGMECVAEKITANGVVVRSGTQLHEISHGCMEVVERHLTNWDVKDFESWYAAKMKDWDDYSKDYKKEIINKKEVIQSEFLSYLGILERKLTKRVLIEMNMAVADLYDFCLGALKDKVRG
jgi:hypothetical protein